MGHSKLETLRNDGVSDLLPWSAFIFSVCTILIVGTCYLSEKCLLGAVYGCTYRKLVDTTGTDGYDRRRRGFVSHHLAATFKILLLCVCADPALRLFSPGPDGFHTELRAGTRVTIGDILLVAGQLYCAYYAWELCYRASLASYISLLHHGVLLIVAQLGMALSAHPDASQDATIEFYMCLVWGAFDIASELPVHIAMILYRAIPERRRGMIPGLLFFCAAWCACCTVVEMAVSAYLLTCSWNHWERSFRIATPVILMIWALAQCISTWQIFSLAGVERQKMNGREGSDHRGDP